MQNVTVDFGVMNDNILQFEIWTLNYGKNWSEQGYGSLKNLESEHRKTCIGTPFSHILQGLSVFKADSMLEQGSNSEVLLLR